MQRRLSRGKELYGTKQVAKILEIPEWRVKNFSEGNAYRMPPTIRVGSGRGSRRLYDKISIIRVGLAVELVNCGFTPESIGRAMGEVPDSLLGDLSARYDYLIRLGLMKRPKRQKLAVLVGHSGSWKVHAARKAASLARKSATGPLARYGVFVLGLRGVCDFIDEAIKLYDEGGR